MEQFLKRIENLLTVKSIVTLALTAVFACQAVRGEVSQDFMMIYTTVIAFYFGTQAQKLQSGSTSRWRSSCRCGSAGASAYKRPPCRPTMPYPRR